MSLKNYSIFCTNMIFSKITFPCSSQKGESILEMTKNFNQMSFYMNFDQSTKIGVKNLGINLEICHCLDIGYIRYRLQKATKT